ARHDPKQRRLAGAVQAEHADLRAGIEAQADVAQDVPLGRNDLGETVRGIDVLCHVFPTKRRWRGGRGLRLSANAAQTQTAPRARSGGISPEMGSEPFSAFRFTPRASRAGDEPMIVITGPEIAAYGFPDGHPFGPDRHDAFVAELELSGVAARVEGRRAREASREEIESFHTPEYVDFVIEMSERGRGLLDAGVAPSLAGVYEAA